MAKLHLIFQVWIVGLVWQTWLTSNQVHGNLKWLKILFFLLKLSWYKLFLYVFLLNQILSIGHMKKMEFIRWNRGTNLFVKNLEVKLPRVQSVVLGLWNGMWKLKVPRKIKHFIWKACSESLPTKANLMKRKILTDPTCHLRGRVAEDTKHALWDCEAVKAVWC